MSAKSESAAPDGTSDGKPRRRWLKIALLAVAVAAALVVGPYVWVQASAEEYTVADVPAVPAALVLGAGLHADGSPKPYLAARLRVAAELYARGKVRAILVSGDHGTVDHDEVAAMTSWLEDNGVPRHKIAGDHAGFDTNDSCHRANRIFGLDQAIVITQHYHLPRAVFLCRNAGIETYGVGAEAIGGAITWYRLREVAASAKAAFDIVTGAEPRFLGRYETSLDEAIAAE